MKIALLSNFIPPYRKSLYKELDTLSSEMKVFVSTEMEKNRSWKMDHDGLNVVVQKSLSYFKSWKHEHGFSDKTPVHIPYDTIYQLRKYSPDVVISGELGIRSLLSALYCKMYKKPLLLWLTLSEYTEKNKKGVRLKLRKFLLNSASALLCNGKSAERYVNSLGVHKEAFFVPYTSDYKIKEKKEKSPNEIKKVLFTGQLIKRKGVAEMVKAIMKWAKKYPNSKMELIVAGDGEERTQFSDLKGIENVSYQLLGVVDYTKLQDLYDQCDFYIFPTLADEWGVVVNEALSSSLPVMGSYYSQAVEELVDDDTGWVFCPDNEEDFVNTLHKALNTPHEELQQMADKGVKKIKEFTPSKVAITINEAVQFVAKKKV